MLECIEQYVIDRVRAKRNELNWTQEDLAAASGYSQGFIGDVESGTRGKKYNLKHLNAFAKAFKCSPRDFLPKEPC